MRTRPLEAISRAQSRLCKPCIRGLGGTDSPRTLWNIYLSLQFQIKRHRHKWGWRDKGTETSKGKIALRFHSKEFVVLLQMKAHQKQEGQSHRKKCHRRCFMFRNFEGIFPYPPPPLTPFATKQSRCFAYCFSPPFLFPALHRVH